MPSSPGVLLNSDTIDNDYHLQQQNKPFTLFFIPLTHTLPSLIYLIGFQKPGIKKGLARLPRGRTAESGQVQDARGELTPF